MEKKNVWMYLFFALLVICAVMTTFIYQSRGKDQQIDYKEKYLVLKKEYIEVGRTQSYLLDVLMKNQVSLKQYMPEYKDLSKEQFDEDVRRKIVRLEMMIRDLEKEK